MSNVLIFFLNNQQKKHNYYLNISYIFLVQSKPINHLVEIKKAIKFILKQVQAQLLWSSRKLYGFFQTSKCQSSIWSVRENNPQTLDQQVKSSKFHQLLAKSPKHFCFQERLIQNTKGGNISPMNFFFLSKWKMKETPLGWKKKTTYF